MFGAISLHLLLPCLLIIMISIPSAAPAAEKIALSAWELPAVQHPAYNPFSKAKEELGKQLFFDSRISGDQSRSCSSCHNPGLGWSDNLNVPMGWQYSMNRHTPTLYNTAYTKKYFWDARANSLEEAIEQHMISPGVMHGGEAKQLSKRLDKIYRHQFKAAFGSQTAPDMKLLSYAIATYIRSIAVSDTAFDRWVKNKKKHPLSVSAKRGYRLFTGKAKCVRCHTPPYFSDSGVHNTGLNSIDPGHYEISHEPHHRNAFKTPGLRNIAITPPYMHTGNKHTLVEVLEFYNKGGDRHGENNELQPLGLSSKEMQDIIAFLKTLTTTRTETAMVPQLPITAY